MVILQTFNKPGGARRISTPMHTALLRSPPTDFPPLPPVALQKEESSWEVWTNRVEVQRKDDRARDSYVP
ncbi:hypothetical protein T08_4591 [Trichinella sp. T8]|nr:hypothetical protein T08_4591 [Trichinella sp. T8]